MSQPSFDVDIKGTRFTLAPICADGGDCNQYTVMSDEHIFRMNQDLESGSFRIRDKDALPSEVAELEADLSNAILNNEKAHGNAA